MKTSPAAALLLLVLCVFISNVASKVPVRATRATKGIQNKIIGGSNTTLADVPYQVDIKAVKGSFSFKCGGSIVSENYVLTAAHCLEGVDYVTVTFSTELNSTRFRIHPSYDAETLDYDVGLVFFRGGLTLDQNTQIINITEENTNLETGSVVRVTGWGLTSEDADQGSSSLMEVDIPIIDQDECKQTYDTLTPRQFCAGEKGKGPCEGDAGSPAVSVETGMQVGIASYGTGCGRSGYPAVFINIADSEVRSFIGYYSRQ